MIKIFSEELHRHDRLEEQVSEFLENIDSQYKLTWLQSSRDNSTRITCIVECI